MSYIIILEAVVEKKVSVCLSSRQGPHLGPRASCWTPVDEAASTAAQRSDPVAVICHRRCEPRPPGGPSPLLPPLIN
ncbi:hypothetical protein EYF80_043206 [Liparis tanakae]|uniref:Uncharacterized protein n=1 Tax=Liparis tanakae TaxID=230148 RepID=A0A4Z2FZD1_9TELE|nr:hypothetical protein EYF80_043206 [Liparis tanakae]